MAGVYRHGPSVLLAAALGLALGCGRGEWRKPLPLPPALPAHQVLDESALCPGGLLCESKTLMRSWRIPVGCQSTVQGRYLAACFLPEAQWPQVVEFFQSRYPATLLVAGGLQVQTSASPAQWHLNPGVVLAKGARTPKPPQSNGPTLSVRRKPTGVELVAVGDATPGAQR